MSNGASGNIVVSGEPDYVYDFIQKIVLYLMVINLGKMKVMKRFLFSIYIMISVLTFGWQPVKNI